jgi:hypothetical protein
MADVPEQQIPTDQWFAHLFGTLYWLLYHQVSRDVFPETPIVSLSPQQDALVTGRVDSLIRVGAQRILPPPPAAPDDRKAPPAGPHGGD